MMARTPYWLVGIVAVPLVVALNGCATCRSVPARCFPSGITCHPRSSQEPINFVHLRQDPPEVYMLGPGDVLGIYIEGVLGVSDEPPPVHFSERGDLPPATGYPIPVREDGTLSLPLIPPLPVAGLTLAQTEEEIRKAYTVTQRLLQPEQERIIVTLIRRRTYRVLVVREDTTSASLKRGSSQGELILGSGKRGMTYLVELPAYENDVLHALTESGGLPGIDAKNEVTILRGTFSAEDVPRLLGASPSGDNEDTKIQLASFVQEAEAPDVAPDASVPDHEDSGVVPASDDPDWTPVLHELDLPQETHPVNKKIVRIPLRATPGTPLPEWNVDDIILATGDIVFIESREAEVFYTGGLLSGGQFPLPRDYDLDILGAIAMAGGSVASAPGGSASQGSLGGNNNKGIGSLFPPTRAVVVRTVNGQQTTIRVNLNRALVDPQERILIEPNDFILLEYKPHELILNILLNNLQFNYFLNNIK